VGSGQSSCYWIKIFYVNVISKYEEKEVKQMNCWEFKKCGREAGGQNEKELGRCPAYPDKGHMCAEIKGTLCAGKIQGLTAIKQDDCTKCEFYWSRHYKGKKILVEGFGDVLAEIGDIKTTDEGPDRRSIEYK
jgi:hypothetical protein